jgi:hypothetical protein
MPEAPLMSLVIVVNAGNDKGLDVSFCPYIKTGDNQWSAVLKISMLINAVFSSYIAFVNRYKYQQPNKPARNEGFNTVLNDC